MGSPSLAVVGSGPAAFYTALRVAQKIPNVSISMFERHAFPFGLARYGVAPDHPEVKNCQERFEELAAHKHFNFFGHCEIGKDVELPKLTKTFDAVLLAYGASSERKLSVPGEAETKGVLSARSFVGWYNGEPEFRHLDMAPLLSRAKKATIIGNGNVALDVARILLRSPNELYKTDMSLHAIEALKHSKVKHIEIVGRRGLLHAAFTNKELRELVREPHTRMLEVAPSSEMEITPTARADKRKLDLIKSAGKGSADGGDDDKTWQLRFLRSPQHFTSDENGHLNSITWNINAHKDGAVVPTGASETTSTELAFTSIGYKSNQLNGLNSIGGQFDPKKHTVVRQRGKVVGTDNTFAAGWIATGPVGVIASTMMDSFSVGDEIVKYLETQKEFKPAVQFSPELKKHLVSWDDWSKIDREEVARGEATGRPREKFTHSEDAIDWLKS